MTVLDKLATALNRRDEAPNTELAEKIATAGDEAAVRELVENLSNRDRNIQSDCIKTLDEIGKRNPKLIAGYCRQIGALLESRNNRLVWGAMAVLDNITLHTPKGIHSLLPAIIAAVKSGSVITRDHGIGILSKLGTLKGYAAEAAPLLLEQLASAPDNQFPMYAEKALAVIDDGNREAFHDVIAGRYEELQQEAKRKRVARVLKQIVKG